MVRNVVARFKLARKGPRINWVPYTEGGHKNVRVTEQGDDGKWTFNVISEGGSAKWTLQITSPTGKYEWPKSYMADKLEEAKKELGHYIDELRSKGTIELLGWKKV